MCILAQLGSVSKSNQPAIQRRGRRHSVGERKHRLPGPRALLSLFEDRPRIWPLVKGIKLSFYYNSECDFNTSPILITGIMGIVERNFELRLFSMRVLSSWGPEASLVELEELEELTEAFRSLRVAEKVDVDIATRDCIGLIVTMLVDRFVIYGYQTR